MPTEITASTDLDSLAQRVGVGEHEQLRSSRSRREPHLQKYACLLAGMTDINVSLNPTMACADMEAGRDIYIPTQEMEQPVTDIPDRLYDLLIQEILTTHEVGHLLYSDWPSLKECMEETEEAAEQRFADDPMQDARPEDWSAVMKECWNAVEDGVIEDELGKAFVVEDELEIINANLTEANEIGRLSKHKDEGGVINYTLKTALFQAFLDISVYDSGKLDAILDETDNSRMLYHEEDANRFRDALPDIYQVVEDMKNEPNAAKRNHLFKEFFMDVGFDLLSLGKVPDVEGTAGEEQVVTGNGRSDDAHEGIGEASDELEFVPGESTGAGDEDDEDGAGAGDEDDEGLEERTEERYEQTLQEEMKDAMGDSTIEEIEEFISILQEGTPVDIDRIIIPDGGEVNLETQKIARRVGRQIRPIIANQLRESRLTQVKRGRANGQLDTRSMMDAERGSVRVFQRNDEGDEKDYSFTILLDRSGSMSDRIRDTEIAVGAFLYALEDLGVDTMCLDFYQNQLRLAKPFGQDVIRSKDTLFTGEASGGTPLSDGLYFARKRVEGGAGTHPAIMVITDGNAGNKTEYQEQLEMCNVPVIGLYLEGRSGRMNSSRDSGLFHRIRSVGTGEGLAQALQQLSREVML